MFSRNVNPTKRATLPQRPPARPPSSAFGIMALPSVLLSLSLALPLADKAAVPAATPALANHNPALSNDTLGNDPWAKGVVISCPR